MSNTVFIADEMFEKVWLAMAQYLSDHARGLVDISENDRTILCNSALNAALHLGAGQAQAGQGTSKFTQMREYMRAHGVVHDAVGYTLLVRVAKQELDEAVRETKLVANRSRQQQKMTRSEMLALSAASAAAERRAAIALRNLLDLWMALGAAEARVQAAGKSSLLDSRLTNGLLAALGSASRLIDVDPLALTATIGVNEDHPKVHKGQKQRDVNNNADDPEVVGHLDFELGYDIDDSSPEPHDDAEDYNINDASFEHQSTSDGDSGNAGSSTRWMPHSDFAEERRARQRKAIVAMSWQLWSSLQTQIEVRAAATHCRGGSHQSESKTSAGERNRNQRRKARDDQEERENVAHVLSTLASVMLRAGSPDDQG